MCNSVDFKYIHKVVQFSPLIPQHLHPLQRNVLAVGLNSLLPPALATTNLISLPMHLPVLDIVYVWNHTMCSLLCPTSFT